MTNIKQSSIETSFYFYSIFLVGVSVGMVGPSLIAFTHQTNKDLADMGVLLLLLPVGFLAGVYICRFVITHSVIHWFVFAATLLYGFTLIGISLTTSFLLLLAIFFLLAVAEGMIDIVTNLMIIRIYKKNSAPYMNGLHFLFGVGTILSPLLVGLNIQYFNSISYAYTFFALLALPALIMLLFVRVQPTSNEIAKPTVSSKNFRILPYIHMFFLFYLMLEVGYSTWIYPYLETGELLNAAAAGFFTSCFWFSFTFFRLIGIFLSMHFHPMKIMLIHAILCLVAIAIIVIAQDQLWLLWLGNLALGGSLAVFFPCMMSYADSGFNIPPKDISHFFTSATAGAMIGPWLLSQIFIINIDWLFYPLVVTALLLLFVLFHLKGISTKMDLVNSR